MTEFTVLDWESDPLLINPTPLDFRVQEFISNASETSSEGNLIIDEESVTSTPSTTSIKSPDSPKSSELLSPKVVPSTSTLVVTPTPVVTSSSSMPPPASQVSITPPVIPNLVPRKRVPWEPPAVKVQRYQSKRTRYTAYKTAYMDTFKSMKNLFRRVKCTPDALPPSAETIKLFDEVF